MRIQSAWGFGLKQQTHLFIVVFFCFSDMEWEFNPLEDLAAKTRNPLLKNQEFGFILEELLKKTDLSF